MDKEGIEKYFKSRPSTLYSTPISIVDMVCYSVDEIVGYTEEIGGNLKEFCKVSDFKDCIRMAVGGDCARINWLENNPKVEKPRKTSKPGSKPTVEAVEVKPLVFLKDEKEAVVKVGKNPRNRTGYRNRQFEKVWQGKRSKEIAKLFSGEINLKYSPKDKVKALLDGKND